MDVLRDYGYEREGDNEVRHLVVEQRTVSKKPDAKPAVVRATRKTTSKPLREAERGPDLPTQASERRGRPRQLAEPSLDQDLNKPGVTMSHKMPARTRLL